MRGKATNTLISPSPAQILVNNKKWRPLPHHVWSTGQACPKFEQPFVSPSIASRTSLKNRTARQNYTTNPGIPNIHPRGNYLDNTREGQNSTPKERTYYININICISICFYTDAVSRCRHPYTTSLDNHMHRAMTNHTQSCIASESHCHPGLTWVKDTPRN